MAEIRKVTVLAAGEAHKITFRPIQGLKTEQGYIQTDSRP